MPAYRKIKILREKLKAEQLDGFLVPSADAYQSEYPPDSARRIAWLTGFTGSAGMVAILTQKAAIFVDGRYTLQAKQQVDGALYEQQDMAGNTLPEWLNAHAMPGARIGFDPWLHTAYSIEALRNTLRNKSIELLAVFENPLDAIWDDRPADVAAPVRVYEEIWAGQSAQQKRKMLAAQIKARNIYATLICAPDSIAWLLNIRGGDVPHTPVALSYAILYDDARVEWFIDLAKLDASVQAHVGACVAVHPVSALADRIAQLKGKQVLLDNKRSAYWFFDALQQARAHLLLEDDPCILPKACKNTVEVSGMKAAHVKDGVALCRFFCWLEQELVKKPVTELDVEARLLAFRKEQEGFQSPSFDTIAGSGAHGAIVHYRATKQSNKELEHNALFLLDSGGQYLGGTTDVTRTIAIGMPSNEHKRRFTQVLKGHIALARVIFPHGISGRNLDVLARQALWAEGLDYAHGTGHGVGAYLGVHEGPQGISLRSDVPLCAGMIVSNEPGFYQEGAYGIRIENLVVVVEKHRGFLGFETITLAPIDQRLVVRDLLTYEEIDWLNAYHAEVFSRISLYVSDEEKQWLYEATKAI